MPLHSRAVVVPLALWLSATLIGCTSSDTQPPAMLGVEKAAPYAIKLADGDYLTLFSINSPETATPGSTVPIPLCRQPELGTLETRWGVRLTEVPADSTADKHYRVDLKLTPDRVCLLTRWNGESFVIATADGHVESRTPGHGLFDGFAGKRFVLEVAFFPPQTGSVVHDSTSQPYATPSTPAATPSTVPTPRADRNSQIAHAQLIEKAKKCGIDVYFVGDSITRRWGTSDAKYAEMLENWKANFFGWNAGNFGWGGDKIENILWRLENGEIDGVNPKVIVILAGTNNVGTAQPDDAKIADITAGIKQIIDVCRDKGPRATIILTAIFPRNDKIAVMRGINRINARLAQLADGKTVRFLNVNDKLADADGRLFDGMTADGLHPTVKGYQVWADGLRPILTELLGPPATTDRAPPPTGDPSATPAH